MPLTDKEIERKLELYRLNKQKQKEISPSIIERVKNAFLKPISNIVSTLTIYILPDNLKTVEENQSSNLRHNATENFEDEANIPAKAPKRDLTESKTHGRKRTFSQKSDLEDDTLSPSSIGEPVGFFQNYSKQDFIILILKAVLWFIIWKLFILMEFGAVFFVFSCFAFIWFSLRSGSRKRRGPSAYSVFNPDCEEILGTYNAEKFEKELLHR